MSQPRSFDRVVFRTLARAPAKARANDTLALDAGLLTSAQAVEHYVITRYGTPNRWAQVTLKNAAALLDETLQEESQTDGDLTSIADAAVNAEALSSAA